VAKFFMEVSPGTWSRRLIKNLLISSLPRGASSYHPEFLVNLLNLPDSDNFSAQRCAAK
jgi:hypothetical protein